jgi:predicted Zn finger-like uncharacterized protein
MIIVCQKCATRLQVDDEKSPTRPFNVKCPKCNTTNSSGTVNPATEQGSLTGSPATDHHQRFEQSTAPVYEAEAKVEAEVQAASVDDAVRMLVELLSKSGERSSVSPGARPAWDRRTTLVCASEAYRDTMARPLSERGYQVYVAEDTRQAVETMRANKLDVVLLEPQFDTAEQGAAFVVREINVLRPALRRRLFFVLISPSLRTLDAHAAFLNNVNAVVNLSDIDELPRILELSLREYNELYREFNNAFNLAAL